MKRPSSGRKCLGPRVLAKTSFLYSSIHKANIYEISNTPICGFLFYGLYDVIDVSFSKRKIFNRKLVKYSPTLTAPSQSLDGGS